MRENCDVCPACAGSASRLEASDTVPGPLGAASRAAVAPVLLCSSARSGSHEHPQPWPLAPNIHSRVYPHGPYGRRETGPTRGTPLAGLRLRPARSALRGHAPGRARARTAMRALGLCLWPLLLSGVPNTHTQHARTCSRSHRKQTPHIAHPYQARDRGCGGRPHARAHLPSARAWASRRRAPTGRVAILSRHRPSWAERKGVPQANAQLSGRRWPAAGAAARAGRRSPSHG